MSADGLSRGRFLGGVCAAGAAFGPLRLFAAVHGPGVMPDIALQRLTDGNARFVAGKQTHADGLVERREALSTGQEPFAAILGCADSRVPPELAFDLGVGELFVVRVAGNFASDEVIGSIEYAVSQLGTRLIVVLGHEKCGAINAVYDAIKTNKPLPKHLDSIEHGLRAALEPVVKANGSIDDAVRANVHAVVHKLSSTPPVIGPAVTKHDVRVVGAEYHLATGVISLL